MAIKIKLSTSEKSIVGIIPARFASSRLLGKPLADIHGKPMVIRTYESCKSSKLLNRIIIAVDDEKVYKTVNDFGAEVVWTPPELASGSDRIAYVAKNVSADIIVNIQGDEPFIRGEMIDQAIEPLLFDKNIESSTCFCHRLIDSVSVVIFVSSHLSNLDTRLYKPAFFNTSVRSLLEKSWYLSFQ